MYKILVKVWPYLAIILLGALYIEQAHSSADNYYNFCRIEPMAVKVVDTKGNVMYFAGTGKNTWIAGPTGWIMGAEDRQVMAGMLHQEVVDSEEQLMAVVECR